MRKVRYIDGNEVLLATGVVFIGYLILFFLSAAFTGREVFWQLHVSIAAMLLPLYFWGLSLPGLGKQLTAKQWHLQKREDNFLFFFLIGGPMLFIAFNLLNGFVYTMETFNVARTMAVLLVGLYSLRSFLNNKMEVAIVLGIAAGIVWVFNSLMIGFATLTIDGLFTLIFATIIGSCLAFFFGR